MWWFDADEEIETWHVSADVRGESDSVASHVGDIIIVLLDLDETHDPVSLLTGAGADLGHIANTIFDTHGGLTNEFEERVEPLGGKLLILRRVQLEPTWRGFGLSLLLTGAAIKTLSGGARAALCYPAPPDDHDDGAANRQRQVKRLVKLAATLGFEHFRDGVYVLDLNLVTLEENLTRLRRIVSQYQPTGRDDR